MTPGRILCLAVTLAGLGACGGGGTAATDGATDVRRVEAGTPGRPDGGNPGSSPDTGDLPDMIPDPATMPVDGASVPSRDGAACTSSGACGSGAWCNLAGPRCQPRSDPPTRSFTTDILPFITRNGCTGCHGPGGVGAIAGAFNVPLVLTGTAWESYQALAAGGVACPEGQAHRLCVRDPSQSLLARRLLTLPGESSPHGPSPVVLYQDWGAPELQMLLQWIAQGATFDGVMSVSSDAARPPPAPDAAPDLPPPPPDLAPDRAPDLAPDLPPLSTDDVTAPTGAAVTALTATGCGALMATWSAADDGPGGTPAGSIRYQLCYSKVQSDCAAQTMPGGSFMVRATLTGMTSSRIEGLDNATYFASVRAVDRSGNTSGVTAVLSSAVTAATAPTMPASLTATRGLASGGDAAARIVTLTWSAATDTCTATSALTYEYCADGTSCATWTPIAGAGATSATIQQNTPCVQTVIGLRAINAARLPGAAVTATIAKRSCFADVAPLLGVTKCNQVCHQTTRNHAYVPFTWDTLVNGAETNFGNCPPMNPKLIVAGNAAASYLTQVGLNDGCRNINMGYNTRLTEAERNIINLWINDGAINM